MTRPRKSTTIRAVHKRLRSDRGPAADYPCSECGGPAREWAYLYNGDPELVAPDGRKYALDHLNCYAPMCLSCHRRHDHRKDPERHAWKAEAARQRLTAINKDPQYHEQRVANSRRNGRKVMEQRIADGTAEEWHRQGGKARRGKI